MKREYTIPRNKCQVCYRSVGRYIMDCYCILCESCFESRSGGSVCNLCLKPTKNNFIDAKNQSSVNKISHLFGNVDSHMNKMLEVYRFQQSIANRYCAHLQQKLNLYETVIKELVDRNPHLEQFIASKFGKQKVKKSQQSVSVPSIPSVTMSRVGLPSPSTGRSTWNNHRNQQKERNERNLNSNAIYHVPNLNYSTAVRSSKRPNRNQDYYR